MPYGPRLRVASPSQVLQMAPCAPSTLGRSPVNNTLRCLCKICLLENAASRLCSPGGDLAKLGRRMEITRACFFRVWMPSVQLQPELLCTPLSSKIEGHRDTRCSSVYAHTQPKGLPATPVDAAAIKKLCWLWLDLLTLVNIYQLKAATGGTTCPA